MTNQVTTQQASGSLTGNSLDAFSPSLHKGAQGGHEGSLSGTGVVQLPNGELVDAGVAFYDQCLAPTFKEVISSVCGFFKGKAGETSEKVLRQPLNEKKIELAPTPEESHYGFEGLRKLFSGVKGKVYLQKIIGDTAKTIMLQKSASGCAVVHMDFYAPNEGDGKVMIQYEDIERARVYNFSESLDEKCTKVIKKLLERHPSDQVRGPKVNCIKALIDSKLKLQETGDKLTMVVQSCPGALSLANGSKNVLAKHVELYCNGEICHESLTSLPVDFKQEFENFSLIFNNDRNENTDLTPHFSKQCLDAIKNLLTKGFVDPNYDPDSLARDCAIPSSSSEENGFHTKRLVEMNLASVKREFSIGDIAQFGSTKAPSGYRAIYLTDGVFLTLVGRQGSLAAVSFSDFKDLLDFDILYKLSFVPKLAI